MKKLSIDISSVVGEALEILTALLIQYNCQFKQIDKSSYPDSILKYFFVVVSEEKHLSLIDELENYNYLWGYNTKYKTIDEFYQWLEIYPACFMDERQISYMEFDDDEMFLITDMDDDYAEVLLSMDFENSLIHLKDDGSMAVTCTQYDVGNNARTEDYIFKPLEIALKEDCPIADNGGKKSETVMVNRSLLAQVLASCYDEEESNCKEYVEDGGYEDDHIFSVIKHIQKDVDDCPIADQNAEDEYLTKKEAVAGILFEDNDLSESYLCPNEEECHRLADLILARLGITV